LLYPITDMALAYTDLTKGVLFIMDGSPYEVIETHFLRMQQRKAVVQTKIRNLITGKLLDRNFQASDSFEEADIERNHAIFIYESKGAYWFHEENNPKARFELDAEVAGEQAHFLKPNTRVQTMVFKEKVIKIEIPVKMDFKVIEAPPSLKGNTAQGGNKVVTIEGGAKVSAPLFVNEGDTIRINTQTGDYVERV
jgi:elongation factor P